MDKKKFFSFLVLMMMASTFFPLLFNNLPPIIRSHHIWTILWTISLVLFFPNLFRSRIVIATMLYGLILFVGLISFYKYIDRWNYRMLVNEYYQIFIGVTVIAYYNITRDYYNLAMITRLSLYFLFITAVMTIISALIDPLYARNITGAAAFLESEREAIFSFKKYGGGTYGTSIAFMAIIVCLISVYKQKCIVLFSRRLLLVAIGIIFIALVMMQFFSNILVAVWFSILVVIGTKHIKKNLVLLVAFFVLIISLPNEIYIRGFAQIGNIFNQNSELHSKFNDFAIFIGEGTNFDSETDAGSRFKRYPQLFHSFIQSPLVGCLFNSTQEGNDYYMNTINYGEFSQVAGTHLHWMNKLTITGIIGILIFFYIPYLYVKRELKILDKNYLFTFILSVSSIFIYGFFKTIAGREVWYTLFILVPGISYLPLLQKRRMVVR